MLRDHRWRYVSIGSLGRVTSFYWISLVVLTTNERLFRFDSCLTLQNSFFFSFDIAFLLYRFRYILFSYFTDFVVSFRWISFSYFTDFVSFRWISFSYFTDFVFVSFRFSVYRYPFQID